MRYLIFFLGTTLLLLTAAASLNFAVDPANIYHEGRSDPQAYADALVQSEHGLWFLEGSVDEKFVKVALAKYSQKAECVVIGSSHVTKISSEGSIKSLQKDCKSILNLGVNGARIEDHIELAHLALQFGRPNKIVMGVDPWTFSFQDSTHSGTSHEKVGLIAKVKNLINLEYTTRSAQSAIRNLRSGLPTIAPAPKLNTTVGGDYRALLKDGSLVDSAKYIASTIGATIPLGGMTYNTNGRLNQKEAIDAYRALLLWIRSQGVEPILLLTPYHENVWKSLESPNTVAMRSTEPIVIELAHELNVKLIGSYDPHIVGCRNNEFYDFMHATPSCLTRLQTH